MRHRGASLRNNMSASKLDTPSHEEIAARAEEIYRQSGCIPGRDLENWVRAENELKQRLESNGAAVASKEKTQKQLKVKPRLALPKRKSREFCVNRTAGFKFAADQFDLGDPPCWSFDGRAFADEFGEEIAIGAARFIGGDQSKVRMEGTAFGWSSESGSRYA